MNGIPPTDRPTRVRFVVLAVLCSLAFLTYLDRFNVTQVQDDIARDLRFAELSPADEVKVAGNPAERHRLVRAQTLRYQGWMFTAFLLGYLLLEVPGGWLGDRFGARAVLAGIVVFWSAFTLLTGYFDVVLGFVVDHPAPLALVTGMVVMRFLVGAGETGAFPNVARAMGGWFPLAERAGATGVIWMCSRLGGAFTFTITAWLVGAAGGWRPAFAVYGIAGAAWALAFYVWFRNRPEQMPAANAAEVAHIRAGQPAIPDSHGGPGTPWGRIFFSRSLWGFYLAAAAISYAWYFFGTFLPKYLKEAYPDQVADQDWIMGLPFFVGAAGCLLGGRLSDLLVRRYGRRRGRSLIGLVVYLIGSVCMLLAYHTGSACGVMTLVCEACFFQDMAVPILWTVSIDVGGRHAGTVAGVMNCVSGVGGALSPLVVAELAASPRFGWQAVFYAAAAAYFLGALLWLVVDASKSVEGPAG